jgi:hypothetical protein
MRTVRHFIGKMKNFMDDVFVIMFVLAVFGIFMVIAKHH